MNPRVEAISILQQARDMLAQRLTERVLEAREEILEDAEGVTYLSEIEAVYEQLGGRLAHINTMLSHLPPVDDAPSADVSHDEPVFTDVRTTYDSSYELDMPVISLPLALPAPVVLDERPQLTVAPASLQSFALYVQTGDLETAARCLTDLLDLPATRGRDCIDAFLQRWAIQPDLLHRVVLLRSELQSGNVNPSLTMLSECFGLQGMESISALQSLRSRLCQSES
jgi:hypothetical protein